MLAFALRDAYFVCVVLNVHPILCVLHESQFPSANALAIARYFLFCTRSGEGQFHGVLTSVVVIDFSLLALDFVPRPVLMVFWSESG